MTDRIGTLRDTFLRFGFDGVVVNPGASLRWLTGLAFHLMERPVLLYFGKTGKAHIILPELELAKLEGLEGELEIHPFGDDPATWQSVFAAALAFAQDGLRIGVEPTGLRFLELDLLQKALPTATFVDASPVFANLRMEKDEHELAKMRKAAVIAEAALLETLRTIRVGQTEKEIASELVIQLYRHGSDTELPFAPIVSSGSNSANPHASPSERRLHSGDVLLFDWGAGFEGYFSDITRCFFVDFVDERMIDAAETVQRSNHYAVAAVRPGMTTGEVDAIARQEIEESGFGNYFTHRTGHGLGMEAHEAPYIFSGNQLVLKKGMVFTIEPGIYLPGLGGIRIEDNVVVTEDGFNCLTTLPREVKTIERYLELMDFFGGLV
ncbi:MAG: Xaa-Pro peptidase family protein [Anaerolineaceae bacterium]|jgi:Xaa-Pro dipeptidase|nr:Xaa-Pro peptidase family protein [Anaerolineaceae bacterium]MDD4042627.1 Xaa-Pro peptidase family protein [Anaerolineaceae bacterium]